MFTRRRPRELLYVPLTDEDRRAQSRRSYRLGRWIDRHAYRGIGVAPVLAVVLPVVLALEALGSPELSSGQQLALTLLWILSIGMVYAFWLFKRQERSEHRRAYRFSEPNERNDLEVAGAKKVLLAPASTETDRESAWELLISRCACTPYHVSFVRDAVRWIGAFLVVGLIFFIILWLF